MNTAVLDPDTEDTLDLIEQLENLTRSRDEWMADGLCAQVDPELFFPEKGGSPVEAKQVCDRCAVRAECLEAALARRERYGVWGGMSERERRKLLARRNSGAPSAVAPEDADEEGGGEPGTGLWTTRQAAEHLGIPVDSNTTSKLRTLGLSPRPGHAGGRGRQQLWDPEQVQEAALARRSAA